MKKQKQNAYENSTRNLKHNRNYAYSTGCNNRGTFNFSTELPLTS